MRPQTISVFDQLGEGWKRNQGIGIIEEKSWSKYSRSIWKEFGKHLGGIWEAFGQHLRSIWERYGRHLGRPIWQEWLRAENHEHTYVTVKNENCPQKFPGNVNFARCFEGRCHQVPISTIEKVGRPPHRERGTP